MPVKWKKRDVLYTKKEGKPFGNPSRWNVRDSNRTLDTDFDVF